MFSKRLVTAIEYKSGLKGFNPDLSFIKPQSVPPSLMHHQLRYLDNALCFQA